MKIYQSILDSKSKKIAVLIDPDKYDEKSVNRIIPLAENNSVDFFFVGGSLSGTDTGGLISLLKKQTSIPVIIFPGNCMHLSDHADGILFLSLISGRNPEYLIGQHVNTALRLKKSRMEIIPTGYILIENGKTTSVEYISNTRPIPSDKTDIVVATAIAGEMLGLRIIYLEAGSGALKCVSPGIVREVKKNITLPLIVGGGIRTADEAKKIYEAGADIIVIGSAVEENPYSLTSLCGARF